VTLLFTSLFEKKDGTIFMPVYEYMILGEKSEESSQNVSLLSYPDDIWLVVKCDICGGWNHGENRSR
jgi:hypothetical protein